MSNILAMSRTKELLILNCQFQNSYLTCSLCGFDIDSYMYILIGMFPKSHKKKKIKQIKQEKKNCILIGIVVLRHFEKTIIFPWMRFGFNRAIFGLIHLYIMLGNTSLMNSWCQYYENWQPMHICLVCISPHIKMCNWGPYWHSLQTVQFLECVINSKNK